MLVVHWSPVSNTKRILREGIHKSKNGLYCFPITGQALIDRWWANFFTRYSKNKGQKYNGFVFRIQKSDLPAYSGTWINATTKDVFDKEITDIKTLEKEYRNIILWRMAEEIVHKECDTHIFENIKIVYEALLQNNKQSYIKHFNECMKSCDFMEYTFEDYQIVLSSSVPASRIIKIIPQHRDFGKIIRLKKKIKKNRYDTY